MSILKAAKDLQEGGSSSKDGSQKATSPAKLGTQAETALMADDQTAVQAPVKPSEAALRAVGGTASKPKPAQPRTARLNLSQAPIVEVIAAMSMHTAEADVCQHGCQRLKELASTDEGKRSEIATVGGIDVVLTAMQKHREQAGVQEAACGALWNLAFDDGNQVGCDGKAV